MKIATPQGVAHILKANKLHAIKSFGQNFIIDYNTVESIATKAEVDKETLVIEIGPGIGSLTQPLLEKCGKLVAVELDKKLPPVLRKIFAHHDHFSVINEDILKVDIKKLIADNKGDLKRVVICGNLPYYITTPILFHLFESELEVDSIVTMMQLEVGERICADHGDRNFNNLSVAAQVYSDANIVLRIGTGVFSPAPKVQSCVVKFDLCNKYEIENRKKFIGFIKKCFKQQRKTIYNNLRGTLEKDIIEKYVDPTNRPATISINIYKELYKETK